MTRLPRLTWTGSKSRRSAAARPTVRAHVSSTATTTAAASPASVTPKMLRATSRHSPTARLQRCAPLWTSRSAIRAALTRDAPTTTTQSIRICPARSRLHRRRCRRRPFQSWASPSWRAIQITWQAFACGPATRLLPQPSAEQSGLTHYGRALPRSAARAASSCRPLAAAAKRSPTAVQAPPMMTASPVCLIFAHPPRQAPSRI